jgi:hypothetical protein
LQIKSTTWLQPADRSFKPTSTPTLAVATDYTVSVITLYDREFGSSHDLGSSSYDLAELHNIVEAPVTCMDARLDPREVVVGYTLNTGPAQFFRVRVFHLQNVADKLHVELLRAG